MKLVSVIIPVYNAMPFLKATVACVLEQTYKPIEIIIVDDGSTDGSFEYLNQLNLPNLILEKNKGKGACAARNYGLELSKGEYIQYLDADDLMSADKIAAQVAALEQHPNYIAVCSTKHFFDSIDTGKITDSEFLYTTSNPKALLLNLYGANGKNNMVGTSAWLAPRQLLLKAGLWDSSLSKDQDGEFYCRVVTRSAGIAYVPEVLNYYRKYVNGSNIANQKERRHFESQYRALASKSEQFGELSTSETYNKAMAFQYKLLAINAYPEFKDISKKALQCSNHFGGSTHVPVLGGRIVELVKHIFGWKAAKYLSYVFHKYILK